MSGCGRATPTFLRRSSARDRSRLPMLEVRPTPLRRSSARNRSRLPMLEVRANQLAPGVKVIMGGRTKKRPIKFKP